MNNIRATIFCCLIFVSGFAFAKPDIIDLADNSVTLLKSCKKAIINFEGKKLSSSDHTQATHCITYLMAYIRGFEYTESSYKYFCLPENTTIEQSARVIVKYFEQNPEELHLPTTHLITKSFENAFPCKYKQAPEVPLNDKLP